MKIAFFEVEDWQKDVLASKFENHELLFFEQPFTQKQCDAVTDVDILSVFIYSKVSEESISCLPNLKLVTTRSTGFDHIDLEACKKRDVLVCNVPSYGENTVAEHTFALILALSRKLFPSIIRTHQQQQFTTDSSLRGFDIKGKTLGLIGCGRIGAHVARIAIGCQMRVIVYDLAPDEALAKSIGFSYGSLEEVLSSSDIISLHIPYNAHTHQFIDKEKIGKMKPGVYLVNTARGGIVNTSDLIEALQDGKVAGAALDVLEGECDLQEESEVLDPNFYTKCGPKELLKDHVLMQMDNVIITPHNAFNSDEALERILATTTENIQSFLAGEKKNIIS